MADKTDTIVAIATPPGRGGIGVVRTSGPGVKNIMAGLVGQKMAPRHARFCKFKNKNSEVIDEGVAIFFSSPSSYTGEDVLELYAHGSRIILDHIVNRALELGARMALPGEFTERAFLNNKLDLVQAEAVADLVDAVSDHAARGAIRSLEGEFSRRVNVLLEKLIKLRMFVEGGLDFPDEDIDFIGAGNISTILESCLSELTDLFMRAKQGAVLKEGAIAVIVGQPNVGKSTLLNKLAGKEIAIVTEEPGTTRDLIEQVVLVDEIPVHIVDTAGLRATNNKAEKEGIARAQAAAKNADILIIIYEYGQEPDTEEQALPYRPDDIERVIVLYNKIDLFGKQPEIKKGKSGHTEIFLSAKTGNGLELFTRHLKKILGVQDISDDVFMARSRHLDALARTRLLLEKALKQYGENKAPEIFAEELRLAQRALGEVTGEFVSDDLLGEIFSKFCIGK